MDHGSCDEAPGEELKEDCHHGMADRGFPHVAGCHCPLGLALVYRGNKIMIVCPPFTSIALRSFRYDWLL